MPQHILERLSMFGDELAVATPGAACAYDELGTRVASSRERLREAGLGPGAVVSVEGDYDAATIALFLASAAEGLIVVPLTRDSAAHHEEFRSVAEVEWRLRAEDHGAVGAARTGVIARADLYEHLRRQGHPGLVLFSSGSTGRSKAAVHDLERLTEKFRVPRNRWRTLVFLLIDHIGGVNTLFYTLANGGAVVVPDGRTPAAVCSAIERHRVELLPTSPTFLNLLLVSGEHERHDLGSLRLITYGTEAMPQSTLERLVATFPSVRFQQTYGLTELGILRSKSRDDGSLWVRVGGEGYETKIVEGRLWIRAASAMLGYLNAPTPFDAEGFFDTGDLVEVDGEWIRIVGRAGQVINVGGSKVHPAEVESAILELDNVVDVVVTGEPHPLTGQIVVATVRTLQAEPLGGLKTRLRQYCSERLAAYKVPVKVRLADGPLHSERFKRVRNLAPTQ